MNPDPVLAAAFRECLLSDRRSLRQIVKEDYDCQFSHAVLGRIIREGVFPKDRRILKLLGVVKTRQVSEVDKAIRRMAAETRKALKVMG